MADLNSRHNTDSSSNEIAPPLDASRDMLAEELLNNINTTPIGKLLKTIAALPEIRQEKVSSVRNQLKRRQYDLNQNLDIALDRVLEELIS